MPFIELELISTYFTSKARGLEKALHEHFDRFRLGNTEWFELPPDEEQIFSQATEQMLSMLDIANNNAEEENLYDYHSPTTPIVNPSIAKPPENHKSTETIMENIVADKPRRLRRLPDYQKLDNPPSIGDEFEFGLLPEMLEIYEEKQSWEAVGEYYGVSGEIAKNIAENEIMPLDNNNRRKFGLCMTYPDFEDGLL